MKQKNMKNLDGGSRLSNSANDFDRKFADKYKAEVDQVEYSDEQKSALLAALNEAQASPLSKKKAAAAQPPRFVLAFAALAILVAGSILMSQSLGLFQRGSTANKDEQHLDASDNLGGVENGSDSIGRPGEENGTEDFIEAPPQDIPFIHDAERWFLLVLGQDYPLSETATSTSDENGVIIKHPTLSFGPNQSGTWLPHKTTISDGFGDHVVNFGLKSIDGQIEMLLYFESFNPAFTSDDASRSDIDILIPEDGPIYGVVGGPSPPGYVWPVPVDDEGGGEDGAEVGRDDGSVGGGGDQPIAPDGADGGIADPTDERGADGVDTPSDISDAYPGSDGSAIAPEPATDLPLPVDDMPSGYQATGSIQIHDTWSLEISHGGDWAKLSDRNGSSEFDFSSILDAEGEWLYKPVDNGLIALQTPLYILLDFAEQFDETASYRLVIQTASGPYYLSFN